MDVRRLMNKRGSTLGISDPPSKRRKEEKLTGWEESFVGDFAPSWDAAYAEDPEAKRHAQLRWIGALMAETGGEISRDQATFDCLLQSFLPYDSERLCNPLVAAKRHLANTKTMKNEMPSETSNEKRVIKVAWIYFNGVSLPLKHSVPFLIGRSYDDHAGLALNLRGFVTEGISRRHAEIVFSEDLQVWTIKGLSSHAGNILVNGQVMKLEDNEETILKKGDVIRISSVLLRFFHQ